MSLFDRFKKKTKPAQVHISDIAQYSCQTYQDGNVDIKDKMLDVLNDKVSEASNIDEIIKCFEEMCDIPVDESMILFETGTHSFSGTAMFYFSLVRQFSNLEDEFYQIHLDVMYAPDDENENYNQVAWDEEIDKNIFEYIRESQEYNYCVTKSPSKIEVYCDET